MKSEHRTKAGGAVPPKTTTKAEHKTARPAKQKVLAKVGDSRKQMMQSPGMQRYERGPKGKPA